MRVLLEAGASTLDEHCDFEPSNFELLEYVQDLYRYPHHSVISHARSIPAARLLLEAGAGDYINYQGHPGFTPLEMILYRCARRRNDKKLDMTIPEICHLVKFLLDNGASPRSPKKPALAPFWSNSCIISGPLIATIPLKAIEIFHLVLSRGYPTPNLKELDCRRAVLIALGRKHTSYERWAYSDGNFQIEILKALLQSGLSPHDQFQPQLSLLSLAISSDNYRAVETLVNYERNIKYWGA